MSGDAPPMPQQAPVTPNYQFANPGGADMGAQAGAGSLANAGSSLWNMFQGAAPGLSGVASTPSGYNPASAVSTGNSIWDSVQGLPGYAGQALQQGFDPQQQLYGRTAQQLTDQTRSGLEARGIDNTPYGAGVEGNVMSNFNIDWQKFLTGNQAQGAGTAEGLLGSYGQGGAQSQAIGQSGPQLQTSILGQLLSGGNAATSPTQNSVADWLSYLSGGNTATSSLNNANDTSFRSGLAANQQGFNQQNSIWSGLGNIAGRGLSFLAPGGWGTGAFAGGG